MTVHIAEVPYQPDSSAIFHALADQEWPVWLDSGTAFKGHYVDILAANPLEKVVYDPAGSALQLLNNGSASLCISDAFECVESALRKYQHRQPLGPGWLGYLSYDLFDEFETVKKRPKKELIPEIALGFYGTVVVNDHKAKRTCLWYLQDQKHWAETLANRIIGNEHHLTESFYLDGRFIPMTGRDDYEVQFNRVKDYILGGDCYQVNLTQQFSAPCTGHGSNAYLALRQAHPSPMSAYFSTDAFDILSLSPERFLQRRGNHIASHPIKGTRPRSSDLHKDQSLQEELQTSLKDRAENVMIVDLLRNDLGRICQTGSVNTTKLFAIESFPNVHHLVSAIEGELPRNVSIEDIFRATFPGGSITGAPKVRAMQIIEELEQHRRGIYCGSMVYFCGNGDFDSNIAIRTLLKKDNRIHCWGGGGVVADSSCNNEYQETFHKVGKLMSILEEKFRR